MTTELHFDEAAHRYTYGGRELISVTQALSEAGLVDRTGYTVEAAARGAAVHKSVQRLHGPDGAVGQIDPAHMPYLEAYLTFRAESVFDVHSSEEQVCDPVRGYAGTFDLRGRFRNYGGGVDLIDIKTGTVPSWVGYQLAAYVRLIPVAPRRRWALNLRADGTYRLTPFAARTDEQVFLAALVVAQAKRGWL
jgi:hypothetical protein